MKRHSDFVSTNARVTSRVYREKRHGELRIVNPPSDAALPIVPCAELFVVDPYGVPTFFKVGLEPVDERFVEVVPVAEKNALRIGGKRGGSGLFNGRRIECLSAVGAEPFVELGL